MPKTSKAELTLKEYLNVRRDQQEIHITCTLCGWKTNDIFRQARKNLLTHRQEHHPEILQAIEKRKSRPFARGPIVRKTKLAPWTELILRRKQEGKTAVAITSEIWERTTYKNFNSCLTAVNQFLRQRG